MIETKIVRESTELINDVIEDYECFGWTVKSTTVNASYSTVTFERETGKANINELRRLEAEYFSLYKKGMEALEKITHIDDPGVVKGITIFGIIGLIMTILAFTAGSGAIEESIMGFNFLGWIVLGAFVFIFLIIFLTVRGENKKAKKQFEKCAAQAKQIKIKARSLLG